MRRIEQFQKAGDTVSRLVLRRSKMNGRFRDLLNPGATLVLGLAILGLASCASAPPEPGSAASLAPLAPLQRSEFAGEAPEPDLPSYFDCLRETGITAIAAHRGGPANGWPENALETFEYTVSGVKTGPVFIEADIARTRDGVLVLMHDDTLERTSTGAGPIAERSFAELKDLRLRDKSGRPAPHVIPTLADVLQWAKGHAILELDIKKSVAPSEVADLVKTMGAERRIIVITYSIDQAVEIHKLLPATMMTVSIETPSEIEAFEKSGLPANQVIAWTGTRAPNAGLDQILAEKGVETAFGTLGRADSWDMRIAASGNDIQYLAIARQGVELLATDRPFNVSSALAGEPGYLEGSRECAQSLSLIR